MKSYITTVDGDIQEVGEYKHTSMDSFRRRAGHNIPHTHRLSSDKRILASYSPKTRRVHLTPIANSQPTASVNTSRTIQLVGVGIEPVTNLRWMEDGEHWVVETDKNLYIGAVPTADEEPKSILRPLFEANGHRVKIDDYRIHPHGVLVETGWTVVEELRQQLFFIDLSGAEPQRYSLMTPKGSVNGASILSNGRIVRVVRHIGRRDNRTLGAIQTLHVTPGEAPVVVDSQECSGSLCRVQNWVPGAEKLIFATYRGEVVFEDDNPTTEAGAFVTRKLSVMGFRPVHTLWANAWNDRVLAASLHTFSVFDMDGNVQWSWTPDPGLEIHAAQFDRDGESVLVAVGDRVLRLQEGTQAQVVFAGNWGAQNDPEKQLRRWRRRGMRVETIIDGLVPLPDGRLAFNKVTQQQSDQNRRQPKYIRKGKKPGKSKRLQKSRQAL